MKAITSQNDLIEATNHYGILPFWSETGFSAWQLSGVNFNALWELRELAVNSKQIAYGKFFNKKATFVSLEVLPYLCALRRDGYDFDSLCDEGLVPRRESDIMAAVGNGPTPSFDLSKRLGIKGFDGAVTALQHKTYLALTFKKSYMGTALLSPPEVLFGSELVRSAYSLSPERCRAKILELSPGLAELDNNIVDKGLTKAV